MKRALFVPSRRVTGPPVARSRRGVALVFVLMFVIAMAAFAISSIFMASNANLLAKSYDRERDLRFAAEAALAIGKSRVASDPNYLSGVPAGKLYRRMFPVGGISIAGADGKPLAGITIQVYVGQTGSSSGQNGRFASIVAEARDKPGNGVIRRLELTQESFAKYAYWSNTEKQSNGTTIFFNNGDELWGPVWSNDTISIGSGGTTFHDDVGTAKTVAGKSYGVFAKPPVENQKPIVLPSTAALAYLPGYADVAGWKFTSNAIANSDESQLRDRVEFVAFDVDGVEDSTSDDEGFFRVYSANAGNEHALRGDWGGVYGGAPSISEVQQCGDWHYMPTKPGYAPDAAPKFYPASVHATRWFRQQVESAYVERGVALAHSQALADSAATVMAILQSPKARCYLAGDPHLVATDRVIGRADPTPHGGNYADTDVHKGGEDTTFTPNGLYGSWRPVTQTAANDTITKRRPWDGRYLNSISHQYNTNAKGVVYFNGNVGVSGVVNGLVTMYAHGDIVILDDLRYANDPVKGRCHDVLGMISDLDVVVADNAINTPPDIDAGKKTITYWNLDDTKDLYIHGVIMALGSSFRVENYGAGPTDVNECGAVSNGRGCLFLSGGVIQKQRGAVGVANGTGFTKRYSYDRCAVIKPPPYFPTTGRFQDNRYLELDPSSFNADNYFKTLSPDS